MNMYPERLQRRMNRVNSLMSGVFKRPQTKAEIELEAISNDKEIREIIEGVKSAKEEWINAKNSFEYVQDEEMLDYFTYKIKACEVRFDYYIRKAKEMGIKVDTHTNIGIPNKIGKESSISIKL